MEPPEPSTTDLQRRCALTLAVSAAGEAATAALAWPFLASMAPSERARALGASVEVDTASMQPGELMTVEWQGKPVWVLRRTDGKHPQLLGDPESHRSIQPEYCRNPQRSIKPEVLVMIALCTGGTAKPITSEPAMHSIRPRSETDRRVERTIDAGRAQEARGHGVVIPELVLDRRRGGVLRRAPLRSRRARRTWSGR